MMWQVGHQTPILALRRLIIYCQIFTAFGIMLGYVMGVAFHNVAGSGSGFKSEHQNQSLVFTNGCGSAETTLLDWECVSLGHPS